MQATLANMVWVWILLAFLLFGGVVVFAVWNLLRRKTYRDFPIRLSRMMSRLGIEPRAAAEIQHEYYMWIASGRCRHCKTKKECDDWQATKIRSSTVPTFCPNARFLHLASVEGKRAS